jgi:hypothetical protein
MRQRSLEQSKEANSSLGNDSEKVVMSRDKMRVNFPAIGNVKIAFPFAN